MTDADIARFWSKVDVGGVDECWPWLGAKHSAAFPYGSFNLQGKTVTAHQVAAFLIHGEPPLNKGHSCHTCDNPPCCNGLHLFWGGNKDNAIDAKRKGRTGLQRHPENISHGEILTVEQVIQIKALDLPQVRIAELYGVHFSTVNKIKTGKNWAHV